MIANISFLHMGIEDFIPLIEINELFNLPLWLSTILVFFFGYITLSWAKKKNVLPKNKETVDDVFLLAASGLTWFVRIALPFFLFGSLLTWSGPINLQLLVLIVVVSLFILLDIYSSLIDLQTINNDKIFKSRKINLESNLGDIIALLLVSAVFSFLFLFQGINEISLLISFMIFLVFTPSIHLQISLIKKLH